jgi:hypothetical protein
LSTTPLNYYAVLSLLFMPERNIKYHHESRKEFVKM